MTHRENTLAILHYENYERMPVVAFGYWDLTVRKWAKQGHITQEEAEAYCTLGDNSWADYSIMQKLGFDFNWNNCVGSDVLLRPGFEWKVLEEKLDGSQIVRDQMGLFCKIKPGIQSIPGEIGTTLTGREAWERDYLPKLQMCPERVDAEYSRSLPKAGERDVPRGLMLGSLMGNMRNMLGVENLSYLYADDEELYAEIVDTLCGLCYDCAQLQLESGVQLDFAHYWEDICYKNGPLVSPGVFRELVGPWYRKISDLVNGYGIDIISLDCDGCIDALLPIWLENGVNTMFPIEVGTWNASIAPWREKYGRELRGVGGMNKTVFALDKKAIEQEVERLKPLIDLGGYIPCPDHRIAPDAKFELVQYYCELMRKI